MSNFNHQLNLMIIKRQDRVDGMIHWEWGPRNKNSSLPEMEKKGPLPDPGIIVE
jgi:hypothetical protein